MSICLCLAVEDSYLFGYKFTGHILSLSLEIEGKMDIWGTFKNCLCKNNINFMLKVKMLAKRRQIYLFRQVLTVLWFL